MNKTIFIIAILFSVFLVFSSVSGGGDVNLADNNIVNLAEPVNAQDAATKNYVDTQEGGANFTVSGAEVFNGSSPTTWTDLDLSGTVGVNSALVILRIESATDMNATAVRQNGDTADYYNVSAEASAYGVALAHHDSTASLVLITTTDTAGVIEWITESTQTVTVDIIAYIK